MATMHYRLARVDHQWVLLSEDVPVESFASKAAALRAARVFLTAAELRHDVATLTVSGEGRATRAAA